MGEREVGHIHSARATRGDDAVIDLSPGHVNLRRNMNNGGEECFPKPAAALTRSPMELRPFSTIEQQSEVIRDYANRRGLEITPECSDVGGDRQEG